MSATVRKTLVYDDVNYLAECSACGWSRLYLEERSALEAIADHYATRCLPRCRHCGRPIEFSPEGIWIDPQATGDDSVWRETCDAHDTFTAEHEPTA
jgi:hypothetical protein